MNEDQLKEFLKKNLKLKVKEQRSSWDEKIEGYSISIHLEAGDYNDELNSGNMICSETIWLP